jgi:hypothetical protein
MQVQTYENSNGVPHDVQGVSHMIGKVLDNLPKDAKEPQLDDIIGEQISA